MAKKKDKRILVLADTHCGSDAGLTPPSWWFADEKKRPATYKLQRETWGEYRKLVREYSPVDILFALGDMIDGKQRRQGGRGLITTDRNEQADMAVSCLSQIDAKKKLIIGGTPYHVGDDEDFERVVADRVGADFSLREFANVNGVVFDLRHWIPSSSIPHGRYTALAKDVLWNDIWAIADMQPLADVTLRAHVHYYVDLGTADPDHRAMIVPGLQAPGGLFGTRKLTAKIDWGMVWFDVTAQGNFTWIKRIVKLANAKTKAVEL